MQSITEFIILLDKMIPNSQKRNSVQEYQRSFKRKKNQYWEFALFYGPCKIIKWAKGKTLIYLMDQRSQKELHVYRHLEMAALGMRINYAIINSVSKFEIYIKN